MASTFARRLERASPRELDDGLDNIYFLLKIVPHVLAGHVRGLVDFIG